jgi:pimeloyl-ACP methyl ester carboxylesterase
MPIGHTLVGGGPERVIVMHGWLADHTVFAPILPYLDAARFSYAFVDYRGYGKSRDIAGNHDMAELAGDAIALADHLGWRRIHLVGHSMGGMAIQRVILDAAGRVKSAVAITPVPASGVPLEGEHLALFAGAAENDANRRAIVDFSTGSRLSGAWLDWMVTNSRKTTTQKAFADYFIAWSRTNFVAEIQGNATPMLVLPGEHDAGLTADVMRATYLAWLPRAELEVMPNSGHYPMQEVPAYLATIVEKFLGKHS